MALKIPLVLGIDGEAQQLQATDALQSTLPQSAYSALPAPASVLAGQLYLATDTGPNGWLLRSNGSLWVSASGGELDLLRVSAPFVMPGGTTNSVGLNGTLNLAVAQSSQVLGGCWMYFPAGAINAGSAAGWYWTVLSTTTTGTVYNTLYTSGAPVPPVSPTPFAGTAGSAFTQTTTEIVGPVISLPAGALGPNGHIDTQIATVTGGTSSAKVLRVRLAGQQLFSVNSAVATTPNTLTFAKTQAQGRTAAQITNSMLTYTQSGAALTATTANTAAVCTYAITLAGATNDYFALLICNASIYPA